MRVEQALLIGFLVGITWIGIGCKKSANAAGTKDVAGEMPPGQIVIGPRVKLSTYGRIPMDLAVHGVQYRETAKAIVPVLRKFEAAIAADTLSKDFGGMLAELRSCSPLSLGPRADYYRKELARRVCLLRTHSGKNLTDLQWRVLPIIYSLEPQVIYGFSAAPAGSTLENGFVIKLIAAGPQAGQVSFEFDRDYQQ